MGREVDLSKGRAGKQAFPHRSVGAIDASAVETKRRRAAQQRRHRLRGRGRERGPNVCVRSSPLPFSPPSARPALPHRTSSYSRRHASFDSPREVPLPFMPSRHPSYSASTSTAQTQGSAGVHDSDPPSRLSCLASSSASESRTDMAMPVFDEHVGSSSSDSSTPSTSSSPTSMGSDSKAARGTDFMDLADSPAPSMHFHSSRAAQHSRPQSPRMPPPSSNTLPLFSRPFSSPDASRAIHSPRPLRPAGVPDRGSTASLPLPADTPYYTLPSFPGGPIPEDQEMRSAAPTRPSSSRPSVAPNQASTSSIPSSSSWQTRRSPSLVSDLEHDEFLSLVANRMFHRAYSSSARSPDGDSAISDRPLPPPAPPTVLTPPPPLSPLGQDRGPVAPYEPFLAHAPPPQDSYIAVDTKPAEYRLLVRLPGFKRDAITVSTRKRRILHVVADSWEPNGGESRSSRCLACAADGCMSYLYFESHQQSTPPCDARAMRPSSMCPSPYAGHFEQRISFGYDALLAQVRAEFDGEHLQVIVPRRTIPVTYQ
ncbi:hypothetical protein C8T65DRAFT_711670 [Cerioporus squamosus]|nr:hypothetical protein C8T65DRAFT_711670 [Cerioporus squamosus]